MQAWTAPLAARRTRSPAATAEKLSSPSRQSSHKRARTGKACETCREFTRSTILRDELKNASQDAASSLAQGMNHAYDAKKSAGNVCTTSRRRNHP